MDIPTLVPRREELFVERADFAEGLPATYQSLRIPMSPEWIQIDKKKKRLSLTGKESLSSTFSQSLLARRVQHFHCSYTLRMDYSPQSFQHTAGLVCYYNTGHHYYFHLSGDEEGNTLVQLFCQDNFAYTEFLDPPLVLPEGPPRAPGYMESREASIQLIAWRDPIGKLSLELTMRVFFPMITSEREAIGIVPPLQEPLLVFAARI